MTHPTHRTGWALHAFLFIATSVLCASALAQARAARLPDDFPLPPGLSPCKPIVMSREVICDWQDVDQHAMYVFFLAALPKAGYTLLPGAQEVNTPAHYLAAIGYKKGSAQGAVTITSDKALSVQFLYGP